MPSPASVLINDRVALLVEPASVGTLFDIGLQRRIYLAIAALPLRGAKAMIRGKADLC